MSFFLYHFEKLKRMLEQKIISLDSVSVFLNMVTLETSGGISVTENISNLP